MSLVFVPTEQYKKSFKKLYRKHPSLPSDYERFVEEYMNNRKGIYLGEGYYKIRIAVQSKNKGKRGGLRIITYEVCVKEQNNTVILVDIYDKSDKEIISDKEYKAIVNDFLNNRS
jgi:hypothetical protein